MNSAYYRDYYAKNKEKRREAQKRYAAKPRTKELRKRKHLQDQYTLTLEQRDEMLASQGNRCAICATTEHGGRDWCVDHNHTAGHVRGLLCRQCNAGLGHFKDDPALIEAAIAYLKEYDDPSTF